jgi:hypothetical protein
MITENLMLELNECEEVYMDQNIQVLYLEHVVSMNTITGLITINLPRKY